MGGCLHANQPELYMYSSFETEFNDLVARLLSEQFCMVFPATSHHANAPVLLSILHGQCDYDGLTHVPAASPGDVAGLIKGKLDQRQACLIVHDVISRDVRKERLPELEVSIGNWCVRGTDETY